MSLEIVGLEREYLLVLLNGLVEFSLRRESVSEITARLDKFRVSGNCSSRIHLLILRTAHDGRPQGHVAEDIRVVRSNRQCQLEMFAGEGQIGLLMGRAGDHEAVGGEERARVSLG